jgi:mono/diheme cytochrome c family protein
MQHKNRSVLSGLVAMLFLIAWSCGNPDSSQPETQTDSPGIADSIQASLDRGRYLANHVTGCLDCHSQRDFTKYAGPIIPGTEGKGGELFDPKVGVPGEIYAPNITPAALKDWTDEELTRAITEGINKKGDTLFPLMPYMTFAQMSQADIQDIIRYIRSLAPIENTVPPRKLFIPIAAAVPPHPKPDLAKNIKPSPDDPVKYGEYLVRSGSCSDCHTPMVNGAPDFARYMAGGNSFSDGVFTVISPNITSDTLTGIGKWTEEMFLQKFAASAEKARQADKPGAINTFMPWEFFASMKQEDLKAIYAYLRTVKPVQQTIVKWPPPSSQKKAKS